MAFWRRLQPRLATEIPVPRRPSLAQPQCVDCNSYGGNGQVKPSYYAFMLAEYGAGAVNTLNERAMITKQWTKPELAGLRIGSTDRIKAARESLS